MTFVFCSYGLGHPWRRVLSPPLLVVAQGPRRGTPALLPIAGVPIVGVTMLLGCPWVPGTLALEPLPTACRQEATVTQGRRCVSLRPPRLPCQVSEAARSD